MEKYDEFVENLRESKKDRNDLIELVPEILDSLKSEDLMFFQYAEGGAMGEGGGVYLLMKNKQLYHTNYLDGYVTLKMLQEKFDGIRDFAFGMLSTFQIQVGYSFQSIPLGYGNSLFVNYECIEKFNQELKKRNIKLNDKFNGVLYQKWLEIAKDIL